MSCQSYADCSIFNPPDMLKRIEKDPEYFSMLTEEDIVTLRKFAEPGTSFGHACLGETMLIYGTYPELVAPDRYDAESGLSTHRADYLKNLRVNFGYAWSSNFPNSYSGTAPFGCSKTLVDAAVKLAVDRLAGIFEALKNDEECVRMAEEGRPC